MKTVILSGGLGYRLKEETEFKPKPMVLIGGKPILWHIMKIYAHYGFNEFVIALGYKGDYIKDYFLNQKYFLHDFTLHTKTGTTKIHRDRIEGKNIDDFKITFVDTGLETLPGERILKVKDYIPEGEDFMVTYGDGVGDMDIPKLLAFHKKMKSVGTISGVHPRSKYGLIKLGEKRAVFEFKEKPMLRDWINGGFMVFKRDFFDYLRPGETEHPALQRLAKEHQLSMYKHEGFWHCMDTYADVEHLNASWQDESPWKIWRD